MKIYHTNVRRHGSQIDILCPAPKKQNHKPSWVLKCRSRIGIKIPNFNTLINSLLHNTFLNIL